MRAKPIAASGHRCEGPNCQRPFAAPTPQRGPRAITRLNRKPVSPPRRSGAWRRPDTLSAGGMSSRHGAPHRGSCVRGTAPPPSERTAAKAFHGLRAVPSRRPGTRSLRPDSPSALARAVNAPGPCRRQGVSKRGRERPRRAPSPPVFRLAPPPIRTPRDRDTTRSGHRAIGTPRDRDTARSGQRSNARRPTSRRRKCRRNASGTSCRRIGGPARHSAPGRLWLRLEREDASGTRARDRPGAGKD